jgi:hypothetical protein
MFIICGLFIICSAIEDSIGLFNKSLKLGCPLPLFPPIIFLNCGLFNKSLKLSPVPPVGGGVVYTIMLKIAHILL